MEIKLKLIRFTTMPESLRGLLKLQLRFMSEHYDVTGVYSPREIANEVIANGGVPMFHIPKTRTISLIADLKPLCLMYRFFKKEKPFRVHSNTSKAGTIETNPAKLAGVPNRLHMVAVLPYISY